MNQGFIKVAASTPNILVADCVHNTAEISKLIKDMKKQGAKIMVFPELCITGYTCGDLFWQDELLASAQEQLLWLAKDTKMVDALIFVGLPFELNGELYNVAAVLNHGEILAIIPKAHIPNYAEYYEGRHFAGYRQENCEITLGNQEILFGTDILLACEGLPRLIVGAEICEDLWVPHPPSIDLGMAGATIIVNLSAGNELTGKSQYRRDLICGQSGRMICGYIYATAGEGESTTDMVFGAHNIISEGGQILAEAKRFENETIYADIDINLLANERRRKNTFTNEGMEYFEFVPFKLKQVETKLTRTFDKHPFVPDNMAIRAERCDEIFMIQAMGLKKRLQHIGCQTAVIGISGGLDSTLAILVMAKAFDLAGLDRKGIKAITMPCFGTTDRTYNNACTLAKSLGAELIEIDIKEAVAIHLKDIGHDLNNHDVTYENAQARERTQVLMDMANQVDGIVVGTGDLSELVLGWATYNGDHMSMYGVNAGVPKTLVRHLVDYYADTCGNKKLTKILDDILDTPVSPELIPPKDGKISQKTEELVGPYELHDFFLYYVLRRGYEPAKLYRIACQAFVDDYSKEEILKWLKKFYWRFFSQQFKRSCLPDGPKVGSVAVSPRGDLRMPSDACVRIWMDELEKL